ncbi:MAG: ribosome maturation factor RimP [Thermoleophilia bacterium]
MDVEAIIERRAESALAEALPRVDLLELRLLPANGGTLRLVVDHPDGVDHGVCADVTAVLDRAGLLDEYGAEVWSPGPEPPLRTAEHFRRAVGRRVRVRRRSEASGGGGARFRSGTLVGADERSLSLATAEGVMEIPLADVARAHALETQEPAR